jgi:hypothetical protein
MSPNKIRSPFPSEELVQQNVRLLPFIRHSLGRLAQADEMSTPRYCEGVLIDHVRQELENRGKQSLIDEAHSDFKLKVDEARAGFETTVDDIEHLATLLGVEAS